MKYLILFLFSINLHAAYIKEKDFDAGKKTFYSKKRCKGVCLKVPNVEDISLLKKVAVMGDDKSKPIRNKYDVSPCQIKEECEAILEVKQCENKFINAEYTEVYCSDITGYEQKVVGKKLVVDEVKKQSHEDAKAAKKAEKESKKLEIEDMLKGNGNIQAHELRKILEYYGIKK